jgi:hypothetical protein
MIDEILNIYQNSAHALPKTLGVKCKYCDKTYTKESTLLKHACEPKRRHLQQSETGVQFGFRSYLKFFELTQGSIKSKTYDDFAASSYYSAFVKFGRYLVSIKAINYASFTEWLLKGNKKLDFWCKDSLYDEWLVEYLRKESYQDALERGIKEMQDYADNNHDLRNGFMDYFKFGNTNRICHHITTGRISPWVVYNCDSGINFLENLDDSQMQMIIKYINPDFWNQKFQNHEQDRFNALDILKAAGL